MVRLNEIVWNDVPGVIVYQQKSKRCETFQRLEQHTGVRGMVSDKLHYYITYFEGLLTQDFWASIQEDAGFRVISPISIKDAGPSPLFLAHGRLCLQINVQNARPDKAWHSCMLLQPLGHLWLCGELIDAAPWLKYNKIFKNYKNIHYEPGLSLDLFVKTKHGASIKKTSCCIKRWYKMKYRAQLFFFFGARIWKQRLYSQRGVRWITFIFKCAPATASCRIWVFQ